MKIFKILQNEGVLCVEGRSGGTRVVPESGRAVKIGVIFSMESNPYIKANSFPLKVIHRLSMSGIGIHILTAHDPHQLYNLCAQFSFRFLLWFHPSEQQLARIAKSGVDLPLIVFDHYSHKLKSYPFPYIVIRFPLSDSGGIPAGTTVRKTPVLRDLFRQISLRTGDHPHF